MTSTDNKAMTYETSLIVHLQGLTVMQRLALNDSAMRAVIELRQLFGQQKRQIHQMPTK